MVPPLVGTVSWVGVAGDGDGINEILAMEAFVATTFFLFFLEGLVATDRVTSGATSAGSSGTVTSTDYGGITTNSGATTLSGTS